MKRIIGVLVGSAIFLLACWWIGRVLHPGNAESTVHEAESVEGTGEHSTDAWHWDGNNISFENSKDTNDNPWGYTAGMIDTDDDGKCIFMTPSTAVILDGISKEIFEKGLSLQFQIHPWVADGSDGAGVSVLFVSDEGKIIEHEEVVVDNKGGWQKHVFKLSVDEEVSKIKLICNSGNGQDEAADWVIIKTE